MNLQLYSRSFFMLFLLIGRIPLWVLFAALVFTNKFTPEAFLVITMSVLVARSFLRKYESKRPLMPNNTFLERTILVKITLVFLWLYIIANPDGAVMVAVAAFVLYSLEYLSTRRTDTDDISHIS